LLSSQGFEVKEKASSHSRDSRTWARIFTGYPRVLAGRLLLHHQWLGECELKWTVLQQSLGEREVWVGLE
jgi:hypothetical protein